MPIIYLHTQVTFAPLAGLEVQSTRVQGGVLVVGVRLSVNLSERPIEHVVGQRRTLLEEMAQGMELEVRAAVSATGGFVNEGVERFKQLLKMGPLSMDASYYNDDEHFAAAVQRTLELKRSQVWRACSMPRPKRRHHVSIQLVQFTTHYSPPPP
jgi:hypothetical protein